jgi:hypothetical protein
LTQIAFATSLPRCRLSYHQHKDRVGITSLASDVLKKKRKEEEEDRTKRKDKARGEKRERKGRKRDKRTKKEKKKKKIEIRREGGRRWK